MRFSAAVMAVTLALGVSAAAQNAKAKSEPRSTAPMKATGAGASGATGKELQKIENEKPARGQTTRAKKGPTPVIRADKSSSNQAINFNGKGGGGSGVSTRNNSSLKGRLKQKGQGKQH
jgi:hypothetical protein